MSAREQRQVASETGLSKQRVVVEAVRLADLEGVDGLSMRRLAGALGAGAMSLYHYVANKDELLDAMIDIVF
jgi:AcrR family transcriptional regulator